MQVVGLQGDKEPELLGANLDFATYDFGFII